MRRGGRLLAAPVSLLLVAVLSFLLLEVVPGDPGSARLGLGGSEVARVALRSALGLSGSVAERLGAYLAHVAVLDLGRSLSDGRLVRDKILERLPLTLGLSLLALALTWGLALALALRGRRAAIALGLGLLYATPVPALALGLLALGAPYGPSLGTVFAAAACLLPLLLPRVHAQLARALDEALAQDASQTLRSVGAPPARVLRAALRIQALRLLTLVALQLPALLSGAVLVEAVFGLPGLGLLAFDALAARDQPVLLGLVLVGALMTIAATLLVDLATPLLDPRLRVATERRR